MFSSGNEKMWEMMGAFYCYYILSLFGYTTIHYKLEGRNVQFYLF